MKIFKESPSVYAERLLEPDTLELIKGYARDGLSLPDIAEKIEIPYSVLSRVRYESKELWDAIQSSRDLTNYKVENALLKSALGYRTKEIKITTVMQRGIVVETVKEVLDKEVHPNVVAAQTWLYNKLPDKWKKNRDKIFELDEEDNHIQISITKPGQLNSKEEEKINSEVDYSLNEINNASSDEEEISDEIKEEWEEYLKKDKKISQVKDAKAFKEKKEKIVKSVRGHGIPCKTQSEIRSQNKISSNDKMYSKDRKVVNMINLMQDEDFDEKDWEEYLNQTKENTVKENIKSNSIIKNRKRKVAVIDMKTKDNSDEEWDEIL